MEHDQAEKFSDDSASGIIAALGSLVHKAAYIDNQPVDLGDGVTLSAVEIHVIDMVGRFPGESMSDLTVRLGVTKGAVSQMVGKLIGKSYIFRQHEDGNRKRVCLYLTKNGVKAFLWHQSLHNNVNEGIYEVLRNLQEGDRQMILEVLSRFIQTMDNSLLIREDHIRWFLSEYSPSTDDRGCGPENDP
jgi:DNA-binding MarR family transcriptional regulator